MSCMVPGPFAGTRAWRDRCACSSSLPWASSASAAPMVSTGPMPKAIEAEFHISMQAAFSALGRAWPPHCSGSGDCVPAPALAQL